KINNTVEKINLVNESMCYLPVEIAEHTDSVRALVDSGSNGTIVDHQLLLSVGYTDDDIQPWRFGKVNLALGNEATPHGTIFLKMKIFHKELNVETIVTEDRRNRLILGIGVIRALGLIIDFKEKNFQFDNDPTRKKFDWLSKEI